MEIEWLVVKRLTKKKEKIKRERIDILNNDNTIYLVVIYQLPLGSWYIW